MTPADAPPPALGELARRTVEARSAWKALPDDSPDFAEYHEYQRALEAFRDACTPDAVVALATGGAAAAKRPWGCSRCGSELFTGEQKSGICGDCAALTPERPADA